MLKFNLKIELNFIKYCMGKGEWGITLVELGKEWGRAMMSLLDSFATLFLRPNNGRQQTVLVR